MISLHDPSPPPPPPADPARERKRRTFKIALVALLASAALVLLLPLRLPRPLRAVVAGIDVIAAGVLYVAYRQTSR